MPEVDCRVGRDDLAILENMNNNQRREDPMA